MPSTRAIQSSSVVVQDTRTDIDLPTESARRRACGPRPVPAIRVRRRPVGSRLLADLGMRSRRPAFGQGRGSLVLAFARFAQNYRFRPVMAQKDQQLTVRVSPEEKREIERRAEAAGLSVSRYLAESGLSDEENRMSSDEREELLEELRELFREVRSIGGHTNQIAKRLNQRKAVGKEAIERASKAIEQASDAIIGKMEEVL